MKQHEADAPVPSKRATGPSAHPPGPNALRCELMPAFPSTVLLAPPMVLIGCGGTGDGTGDRTAEEPGDPLLALPPGEVASGAMPVSIDMPAAMPAAAFVVRITLAP